MDNCKIIQYKEIEIFRKDLDSVVEKFNNVEFEKKSWRAKVKLLAKESEKFLQKYNFPNFNIKKVPKTFLNCSVEDMNFSDFRKFLYSEALSLKIEVFKKFLSVLGISISCNVSNYWFYIRKLLVYDISNKQGSYLRRRILSRNRKNKKFNNEKWVFVDDIEYFFDIVRKTDKKIYNVVDFVNIPFRSSVAERGKLGDFWDGVYFLYSNTEKKNKIDIFKNE